MKSFSLLGAVKFFGELSGGMERVKHGALEEAAQVIGDRAKELIGHQQASWPPLKPETVVHKVTGDSPLLGTGEMRDPIGHVVDGHEAVIGSDLDKAVHQEMGTEHIPPRSFLGLAAHEEGHHVAEMIGEHMANYLA